MLKALQLASPLGNAQDDAGLELTPLLDIVFLVVAFLLLTANVRLWQLPVDLPSAQEGQATAPVAASVALAIQPAAPHFRLDDGPASHWPEARQQLDQWLASHPDGQVLLQPDREAPVQALVQALAHLQSTGHQGTRLLLQPES